MSSGGTEEGQPGREAVVDAPSDSDIIVVNPSSTASSSSVDSSSSAEALPTRQRPVVVTQSMFDKLKQSEAPVRPYTLVEGLQRTKPILLERELQRIYACTTMKQLLRVMNESEERWASLPVFNDLSLNLEPLQDPNDDSDVLVRVDVKENLATREVGVYTTESLVPEMRLGMKNLGGKGYSLDAHYIPPASKLHSAQISLTSFLPLVGDRCEYTLCRRNEGNQLHAGDMERVTEGRIVTTFGLPNSRISPWCSTYTLAFQRHLYTAKDKVPSYLEEHFDTPQHRVVARQVLRFSNVKTHTDGYSSVYALPISGTQVTMVSEAIRSMNFLLNQADEESSAAAAAGFSADGAVLSPSRERSPGGTPYGLGSTLLKHETQITHHIQLLKTVVLDLGLRAGGSFRVTDDLSCRLATETDLPLCDRHFLNWRHVRGHRNIGPSTLSLAQQFPTDEPVTQYRALGGNVVWAAQASLNFPFIPYPPNGLVAMHLFANAGNINLFSSGKDLWDNLKSFILSPTVSVGLGFVITKLPFFGALSGGRLEFNVAVPLRFDDDGYLMTEPKDRRLFSRWHFGLHWVNAAVCGGHN